METTEVTKEEELAAICRLIDQLVGVEKAIFLKEKEGLDSQRQSLRFRLGMAIADLDALEDRRDMHNMLQSMRIKGGVLEEVNRKDNSTWR